MGKRAELEAGPRKPAMQMTRSLARSAAQESDSVELPGLGILAQLKAGRSGECRGHQGESRGC